MIFTSKKQLISVWATRWFELSDEQKNQAKNGSKQLIASYCKDGYTQYALWLTDIGLVRTESYGQYCDIQKEQPTIRLGK